METRYRSLLCRAAAAAAGVFLTCSAYGFTADQNYYAPLEPELLGSAETHHMQVGIDQMQTETRTGNYNYQGSFGDFKYILDYFPNHPRALALASDLAIRAKHPEWIEPYFRKSLSLYPNYGQTHVIYGAYLQKRGQVPDAIAAYLKALEIQPDLVDAQYNLGLAYLAQRNLERSNFYAQKAYKGGIQYSGLHDKLVQAGAWKELNDPPEGPGIKKD